MHLTRRNASIAELGIECPPEIFTNKLTAPSRLQPRQNEDPFEPSAAYPGVRHADVVPARHSV
jgi:hypothetical protein